MNRNVTCLSGYGKPRDDENSGGETLDLNPNSDSQTPETQTPGAPAQGSVLPFQFTLGKTTRAEKTSRNWTGSMFPFLIVHNAMVLRIVHASWIQ